ncbi:hypothetical protein [Borrelia persica]|uniref:hypothetical protein n=1 Tax=Borrelia persica TaxID=44448 RepID=UPI000465C0AB|nr:hypothetical protein [Borrelia persica]
MTKCIKHSLLCNLLLLFCCSTNAAKNTEDSTHQTRTNAVKNTEDSTHQTRTSVAKNPEDLTHQQRTEESIKPKYNLILKAKKFITMAKELMPYNATELESYLTEVEKNPKLIINKTSKMLTSKAITMITPIIEQQIARQTEKIKELHKRIKTLLSDGQNPQSKIYQRFATQEYSELYQEYIYQYIILESDAETHTTKTQSDEETIRKYAKEVQKYSELAKNTEAFESIQEYTINAIIYEMLAEIRYKIIDIARETLLTMYVSVLSITNMIISKIYLTDFYQKVAKPNAQEYVQKAKTYIQKAKNEMQYIKNYVSLAQNLALEFITRDTTGITQKYIEEALRKDKETTDQYIERAQRYLTQAEEKLKEKRE